MEVAVMMEVYFPSEAAGGQVAIFGITAGACVINCLAALVKRTCRGLGNVAGWRGIRGDGKLGVIARCAPEAIGYHGTKQRAVIRRLCVRERVVDRCCSGNIASISLPLIAERRRAGCADAERSRLAYRDSLILRMRRDHWRLHVGRILNLVYGTGAPGEIVEAPLS